MYPSSFLRCTNAIISVRWPGPCAAFTACCLLPADIQTGQGLYFETLTKTYRAKDCDSNSYGVSNVTYGLNPDPCRTCPDGTVASNMAAYSNSAQYFVRNSDGTGGFNNVKACVTKPGGPDRCCSMGLGVGLGFGGWGGIACVRGSYGAVGVEVAMAAATCGGGLHMS